MTRRQRRRGSIYLAVLGSSMLITVIGLGALAVVRVERRTVQRLVDMQQARIAAHAGLEHVRDLIDQDANWRTTFEDKGMGHGQSTTFGLPVGEVTVTSTDTSDASLSNLPHDAVTLSSRGRAGASTQIYAIDLVARPLPLPVLSYGLATRGGIVVESGYDLRVDALPILSQLDMAVWGSVTGSVVAPTVKGGGPVSGAISTPPGPIAMPDWSSVLDLYARMAVTVPSSNLDRRLLAPGFSSFGVPSPSGVYIINSPSNSVTIRDSRLLGTLIISAPGQSVTLDNMLFFASHRSDFPTLIIVADEVIFNYDSTYAGNVRALSEVVEFMNFNPSGAPFGGSTDSDLFDLYPSEVHGTVLIRGRLVVSGTSIIRGNVIVDSPDADAITIKRSSRIVGNASLQTSPPQGFTARVDMAVAPGGWRQVVDP